MTLKTRNRTLIAFIAFSILCFAASFTIFFTKTLSSSYSEIFGTGFFSLSDFSLIKPCDKSIILSLLFLQIYIPVTACFLFFNFEKTQTTLIILFCMFLLGCQLNIARLVIGLYNLNVTYPKFYILLGKAVLFGNLLLSGSLLLISSESKQSQKLNIEIDIIILVTLCLFTTYCLPLNTVKLTSPFTIKPGYVHIIYILISVVILLTIITYGISYHETENKSIIRLLVSFLHFCLGIHLLTDSNIFLLVLFGGILLSVGTRLFMKALHSMFLWD